MNRPEIAGGSRKTQGQILYREVTIRLTIRDLTQGRGVPTPPYTPQALLMPFAHITINPKQISGVPCIRGLRIPVAMVVGILDVGISAAEVL